MPGRLFQGPKTSKELLRGTPGMAEPGHAGDAMGCAMGCAIFEMCERDIQNSYLVLRGQIRSVWAGFCVT